VSKNLRVRIVDFSTLREIEGARSGDDFAALLDAMEFGDTAGMSADELREMCVMSLQDRRPEEAAELILKHDLGDRLRDGQIRNIASEMLDDKMWEEYSDMSLHERLFNVGSLLYEAFPRAFPEPDVVRVRLEVVAVNEAGRAELTRASRESFLVRLLADGMDAGSVLHRLFDEQLAGRPFPEAETIVWTARIDPVDERTAKVDVISSGYWLDALGGVESYESSARAADARAR